MILHLRSARRPSAYAQVMEFRPYPVGYVARLEDDNRRLRRSQKRYWRRVVAWVARHMHTSIIAGLGVLVVLLTLGRMLP